MRTLEDGRARADERSVVGYHIVVPDAAPTLSDVVVVEGASARDTVLARGRPLAGAVVAGHVCLGPQLAEKVLEPEADVGRLDDPRRGGGPRVAGPGYLCGDRGDLVGI